MKRVIFVGIHNKPGLPPLCSTTRTGKVIDRVISKLIVKNCERKNIFPVEYMPKRQEAIELTRQFEIDPDALYVGLGKVVCNQLWLLNIKNLVPVHHPSYMMRQGAKALDRYVVDLALHINCEVY